MSGSHLTWAPDIMENLFQKLYECGQNHGLANDDFKIYRRYCTRKMRKLRIKNKTTKEAAPSKELLEVLVFKCEWTWAQSSLLRSQLHSHPRKRFHLRRVAKSSFKTCMKLKAVAAKVFDDGQFDSYAAYSSFLAATASLDLELIEKAFAFACKSKQLLLKFKDSFSAKKLDDVETLLRFIEYKSKGFGIDLKPQKLEAEVEEITESLEEAKLKNSKNSKRQPKRIVHVAESSVNLSPSVMSICKSPEKSLQVSLTELSKSPLDPNLQLQVLYFEILRFKTEFKFAVGEFLKSYRQHDGFKKLPELKRILLRVKHAHFKSEIQSELQNALQLLNAFSSVYKGQVDDAKFVCENFFQSSFHAVPSLNRLFDALLCLIDKKSCQNRDKSDDQQPAVDSIFNKGIFGMFSSFFSKRK